jgi:hypothetical protein
MHMHHLSNLCEGLDLVASKIKPLVENIERVIYQSKDLQSDDMTEVGLFSYFISESEVVIPVLISIHSWDK